ncbi:unnamed protein product, partial [Gulo gulo]
MTSGSLTALAKFAHRKTEGDGAAHCRMTPRLQPALSR